MSKEIPSDDRRRDQSPARTPSAAEGGDHKPSAANEHLYQAMKQEAFGGCPVSWKTFTYFPGTVMICRACILYLILTGDEQRNVEVGE
jgi:hypothetical protein